MASNSQKDIPSDDKAGSADNITVKDEVSSKPTVKNEASSKPTAGPTGPFAANPFDCSAMSGLLNDPSIKELTEQIAEDPSFNKMVEKTLHGASQDGRPDIDNQKPLVFNKKERMALIDEDPSLKNILDEIETHGPAAMMRYWNDEEVLKKLGLAMGIINPNTGEAAASSDNSRGLGPPFPGQWNLYAQTLDSNSHLFSTPQGP